MLKRLACGRGGRVGVGVGACGSSAPQRRGPGVGPTHELIVFAAASLTGTFTEIGKQFEAAHPGTKVDLQLRVQRDAGQQITQGAPADVFAAASPATMKTVADAGLAGTQTVFVKNKLEIAVPPDNPAEVDNLKDLTDPKVKVALCAEQVPCGAAAVKALGAAGLKVTPVTLEQDVKATLTKVELGEVDAALVYKTDVIASAGKVTGIPFPEADQAINDYPIAPLTKAPAPALARQFVDLVLSQQGQGRPDEGRFRSAVRLHGDASPGCWSIPAVLGMAFLVLPLAGLLVRAPWSTLPERLAEPQVLEALRLSLGDGLRRDGRLPGARGAAGVAAGPHRLSRAAAAARSGDGAAGAAAGGRRCGAAAGARAARAGRGSGWSRRSGSRCRSRRPGWSSRRRSWRCRSWSSRSRGAAGGRPSVTRRRRRRWAPRGSRCSGG